VVVAREVTKLYEEFMRGRIETLLEDLRKKAPRGEITLLIAPPDEETSHAEGGAGSSASAVPLAKRVEEIALERGVDTKSALKVAARERGLTRREAYKQLLITRDEA
jgi:16S rRNA (cytidine1402-2'-O)-methyltransferase